MSEDNKKYEANHFKPTEGGYPTRTFKPRSSSNSSSSNYRANPLSRNNSDEVSGPKHRSRNRMKTKSFGARKNKRKNISEETEFQSKVIEVRRVTRVVKGGKRMRFSAMVVVGDGKGNVGCAVKKGLDFQDAVAKATNKAKQKLVKVKINDEGTLDFPSKTKHKAAVIFLKPAKSGTGLIAGGYIRPILELAGVSNLYSKIVRTRNKIAGTQAVIEALKKYEVKA
jgi:small subunit ribosomal protein S5